MTETTTQQQRLPMPAPFVFRSEAELAAEREEIRALYSRLILRGTKDAQAFDRCEDAYGYVPSIRALKAASPHAKRLSDAYWAKRAGR